MRSFGGRKFFQVSLKNKFYILIIIINLFFSCSKAILTQEAVLEKNIENVPFYPQKAYQCGPASLAGVLNYWGINVLPDDIATEIYSSSAKGTLTLDMKFYAEKRGLKARIYKGSLTEIKEKIDSGYPLIVLVDFGFWILKKNHFMVITGYNVNGVIVNSGKERQKFIPKEEFLKSWEKTGFWTLLITQK